MEPGSKACREASGARPCGASSGEGRGLNAGSRSLVGRRRPEPRPTAVPRPVDNAHPEAALATLKAGRRLIGGLAGR